jgi:hypothetical protein
MRYDFAGADTQAQKFIGTELTGGACVGCHALSRDGSRLVAEAGGQNDGRTLLMDVASHAPLVPFGSGGRSTFESWSPDGSRYVGVYGDRGATDYNLLLFDGRSGAPVGDIPGTGSAAHPADHPDWSPDGGAIVYTRVGVPNTLQRMGQGGIGIVRGDGQTWSAPTELVPAAPGKNRYYPSFSPDGEVVIFDESTCGAGDSGAECDADTDPSATLFAVPATGGTPIALARANAGGVLDTSAQLTNTFPKWSPFIFNRSAEFGSRVEWLTFSSTRRYGLREPPPGGDENPSGTLIWMAAVDPDKPASGADPSYPAFALPFQDVTTSNHIAQWAERVATPIQ